MAEGEAKDVRIKISTEGGDQAKATFGSLIESLGGLGGAVVVANQGLELLHKGFEALEKPIDMINELAAESISLFKQLRSLSAVTGQTIQEAEQMQNAFALAGLSTEKLGFAMFRLSMNIEQGGKELQHMGVEMTNASGASLSTGDVFENVRNKISGMTSASERASEAAKIFGARQARELMPILSMSATAYERLKDKAESNEAMTTELAKAMGPLIESEADLAQKAEKVRMEFAETIAVPLKQFFVDLIAIPVVEWFDGIIGRWKSVMAIGVEGAQGEGGLMGFVHALMAMAGTSHETAEEYRKNMETLKKAEQDVKHAAESRGEAQKKATEESIKVQTAAEKDRYAAAIANMKAEASISEALTRMRTDSDQEALREKLAINEKLIQAAQEHYEKERAIAMQRVGPGGRLTEQEEQKLSSERDKAIQKIELESRRVSEVDMAKARVADAKKVADEQVKIAKDSMAQQTAIIESARKREAAIIETTQAPTTEKIIASYFSEVQAVKESSEAKIDAINREIDAKRALAAAAPQDLHLQRQVADEIRDLDRQRVETERANDDKILELRKNMVQGLRAEAEKQAQTGATLEERALARLEQRGRKMVSMQDVQEEVYKMRQQASETAGGYVVGGRVGIARLREARQLAPVAQQLTEEGITGGQAVGVAAQKSAAQLGGYQWSAVPAQLQASVGQFMSRLQTVESGISTTMERMTAAIESLYIGFSTRLVRELEFQAARQ